MSHRTEDVAEREALRWSGLGSADAKALSALTHDDLIYTHSNGMIDTKDTYIGRLSSGVLRYVSIEPSDQRVVIHGDTAIATGRADLETEIGGNRTAFSIRYTAVWVYQGGEWLHVAWHASPDTIG